MTNLNVVIIGAGSIGFQLAKRLSRDNYNISLIESDPGRASYAKEHVDARVIEGFGSSQKTLLEADIENADILAALSNNDEVNLLSCAMAKAFGVPTTIARVRNPEYRSGEFALYGSDFWADYVIQPERQAANVIVRLIRQANATDVIEFEDGKFQLIGLRLGQNAKVLNTPLIELAGKLSSLNLRIVAIKRGQFTVIPRGQDILIKGDQIFIISSKDDIPEALEFFGKSDKKLENIMIIGGGQIGRFIAKDLEKDINVKILESNTDKSESLADELKHALVIKGDGSDIDLLAFEGLPDMDDFVAVTGDDETNIITSLVAKHLKVPRTITLLAKNEYIPLTPSIGLDAVVSKEKITVNAILKFIRRQKVAFYAEITGVDAEVTEYIAKPNSKIIKKPLRDINFPNNAIVGAVINNDNELEIPTGLTRIQADNKVIVFSLPKAKKEVDKLF